MIAITADNSLKTLLEKLTDVAQVRDANGEIIGYLTPPEKAQPLLYELAKGLIDPKEAERLAAVKQCGSPLVDVMKRIHTREHAE